MSATTQSIAADRIKALLDEGSFVEVGSFVTARATDFNLQEKKAPGDGAVTGYGTIAGKLVYVYAQDGKVLGGSLGEMQAKKIRSLYVLAEKMGAPVIGLLDCSGIRLQESTDALAAFGDLFNSQVRLSGVIPQITAVFGNCGGGMALLSQLSDFVFVEQEKGKLFINTPNVLEGNYTAKKDTASAAFAACESGMADFAGSAEDIYGSIRSLVDLLPGNNMDEEAGLSTEDMNRLSEGIDAGSEDPACVLSLLSDDGTFFEVKQEYAKEMVCAFIRLNGQTVGVVGNRLASFDEEGKKKESYEGLLTTAGCEKAADFVNFCDAFNIPLLTLNQVSGFAATTAEEKTVGKAAARLTRAFAGAAVPKISLLVGSCYGTAVLTLNTKSTGADLSFAWPKAALGLMEPEMAVKIMYGNEIASSAEQVQTLKEKAESYKALQASAEAAARRGYVDDIIDPAETRKVLIASFDMLFTKRVTGIFKKHSSK